MKYSNGRKIVVGDRISHNCGRDVGTIVIIAETPEDIQAHGYEGPTFMFMVESQQQGLIACGAEEDIVGEEITLIRRANEA